jgi:DNA-binding MarR family transcriptional regulator
MTARKPAPGRPQMQLGFLTSDVLRLLRADFVSRTGDMPLTPALHRLLINVDRRPGCRQVELAEWLDITPVTVGRMIDRLEKQKLVRRENEPGDRRVYRVYIAAGARSLLAQLNDKAQQTRERAFRGMSAAQRDELLDALAKLRENLQADSPAAIPRTRRKPLGR